MHLLFILLQAAESLPTNIWTVGGALALFAGVIAYLFKLYDSSQEKRLAEMKANFEGQITGLRNDLNDEKLARRGLQDQMNNSLNGQLAKNNATLEKVEDFLAELKKN
jgi:hypothetical protein